MDTPSFDNPQLQGILEAELAAGNVVAAQSYERFGVRVIDLRAAFHEAHAHTRAMPDVELALDRRDSGTPADYEVIVYRSADECLCAPRGYDDRSYESLAAKALVEGRVVSANAPAAPGYDRTPPDTSPAGLGRERQADAARLARAIEREMRLAKMWSETPPPAEAFQFQRAFAMDTMAFDQWLQFVLLPRLRACATGAAEFPPNSSVAPVFVREYDGREEDPPFVRLSALVHQLDELINGRAGYPATYAAHRPIFGDARERAYLLRQAPWFVLMLAWMLGVPLVGASDWFKRVSPWRTELLTRTVTVGGPRSGAWDEIMLMAFARQAGDGARFDLLRIVTVRPNRSTDSPATSRRFVPADIAVTIRPPLELHVRGGRIHTMGIGGAAPHRPYDAGTIGEYLRTCGVKPESPEQAGDVERLRTFIEGMAAAPWSRLREKPTSDEAGLPLRDVSDSRWQTSGLGNWQGMTLMVVLMLVGAIPCLWMVRREARRHFGR